MIHKTTPGVDRAVAAARKWAGELQSPDVGLVHYLLGLLDEEDGIPASLLAQLGFAREPLVQSLLAVTPPGPSLPLATVLNSAREWSLSRRADPTLMTDSLLIAVLALAPADWPEPLRGLATRLDQLLQTESSPMAGPDEPPTRFDEEVEELDLGAARILDANFNRSREALRVLEDYCRFVQDDPLLTSEIKAARHSLAEASKRLPDRLLLSGRDTMSDVGTTTSATGEYQRSTPAHVARVNLKRLQESLRSLEEFGKLHDPELARELEAIRYRTYTIERALANLDTTRTQLQNARLHVLLTESQCAASLEWTIAQAAAGGADVFQLREKTLTDRELLTRARNVRRWTRAAHTLMIVNDRPDIAKLAEADGVHLGQDDMPVRAARRILGSGPLIGVSTHSLEQVRQAVFQGADYIGIGPTFPSTTKSFDAFPGLEFIRAASSETTLPAFALGGIGPGNVASVVAAGARRVAVSSCIAAAAEPEAVARALRTALGQ